MTQRPSLFTLFLLLMMGLAFAAPAHAERIKDMGQFQGLRANQLTGYGLVVGLAGTGDDSLDYSTLGMKGAVSRFGLTLPPGVNPALKNAAVFLYATPEAREGRLTWLDQGRGKLGLPIPDGMGEWYRD